MWCAAWPEILPRSSKEHARNASRSSSGASFRLTLLLRRYCVGIPDGNTSAGLRGQRGGALWLAAVHLELEHQLATSDDGSVPRDQTTWLEHYIHDDGPTDNHQQQYQ